MTFHLVSVHIVFSSFWVAEWPPFTRLTILYLCFLLFLILVIPMGIVMSTSYASIKTHNYCGVI